MATSLSITVHPSGIDAEYLSVSDAMRQVLDFVESLIQTETVESGGRQIIWRLTEAHTNSPPFTVTAEAFSADPTVFVGLKASRVSEIFSGGLKQLLDGNCPDWVDAEIAAPLKRVFQRNLNGVGRTEVVFDRDERLDILPQGAKIAVLALERRDLAAEADAPDLRRTEYGAAEVEVCGIMRWNDKPALSVIDRLSGNRIACVLGEELAEQLGPSHRWEEAWDGRRLLVSGQLHYGSEGDLKRIDAEAAEEMPWTDVSLSDLRGIDILQGRSVREHLEIMRGQYLD